MKNKNIDWEDEFEQPGGGSDHKELFRFVGHVLSKWYWFLICGLIGFILAFAYVRYTIPTYKISAKLLVSDDKKGGGMLSASALGDLSGLMGAKNSVDNEVEVLKTIDLMQEMVIAEQEFVRYFKVGTVHNVPEPESPYKLSLLSPATEITTRVSFQFYPLNENQVELSNADTSFVVQLNKPFEIPTVGSLILSQVMRPIKSATAYGFRIEPLRKVVAELMKALNVGVTNKNVSTINLSLDYALAKRGEMLLSSLVDRYVERNLHDKNVIADSTLTFINTRLSKITEELAGVEDRISGYKQTTKLADITEQSKMLIENASDYTKSLAETETQLDALQAIASYLQDERNLRVVPSSVLPVDNTFNSLISRYNELLLQRDRLLLGNTEENPLVQNVVGQIASLREDMVNNVASTRRQLELSKRQQQQLASHISTQIQQVPMIERGYIDLARLQQIKQAQYIFLQQKWEETAIGRTANVSNSKLIDSPKADEKPFAPKGKIIYAMGLLFGLVFPLIFLYIKDLFNIRIESMEDVKRISQLPVLGIISHSEEKEQVVVNKTSRSPIAEQFRALRTNLEFSLQQGNTILLTSSMSGEGKSYVALNLAVSLALLDKKVLLMELDLRKPSITAKLGLPAGKGFSHYVVRPDMDWAEIIMPSGIHDKVDLIQAGAIPPNPAELLVAPRSVALLEKLKESYDYILMDAPPVGLVTDAQLLNRYADLCLYLVRQGFTYKEQLRIPKDLVAQGKIKHIQLVVNDVHTQAGFYNNYGYGYGYGYGYAQEVSKEGVAKTWFKKLFGRKS